MTSDAPKAFLALDELRTISAAFEAEVRSLEADPSLPLEQRTALLEWTGRELVAHLSAIYRWCTKVVTSSSKVIRDPEGPLIGSASDWFAESRSIVLDALSAHAPDGPAYTFQRDNRTVGFWHRRMLHETLVHLWDLRSIRDPRQDAPHEVAPAVHADGVSELFEAFAGRVDDAVRAGFTGTMLLRATDAEREWLVGPEFRLLDPADADSNGHSADVTVSGPAGSLLLLVWNRCLIDNAALSIRGKTNVAAQFSAAQLHP